MDSSFVSVSHHDGPNKAMHSPVSHTLAGQCDQRVLTGWTGLGAEPLGLLACGQRDKSEFCSPGLARLRACANT